MEVFGVALLVSGGLGSPIVAIAILCCRRLGPWRLLAIPLLLITALFWGWLAWWDCDERVNGNISLDMPIHSSVAS